MNPISMISAEDLNIVYGEGSVLILGKHGIANSLKNFPVQEAEWEELPEGTMIVSGKDDTSIDHLANNNRITENVLPEHNHTRGNMNITGQLGFMMNADRAETQGAFTCGARGGGMCMNGSSYAYFIVKFNAENTWTGSTSSYGKNSSELKDITTILKYPKCFLYRRIK